MIDYGRAYAHQDAVSAQRRLEFGPTADKLAKKRQGRAFQILDRLRRGPATTWELMMLGGAGFSSRIRELRVDGYEISVEMNDDHGVYTLRGEP